MSTAYTNPHLVYVVGGARYYGPPVTEIAIRPLGPYSLRQSMEGRPNLATRRVGRAYELVFRAGPHAALAHLAQRTDGRLIGWIRTEADIDEALAELRFTLALDHDHAQFLDMASRDDLLTAVVARQRGFRPVRTSVAQALVHGFAGQLISASEAWRIERAISADFATAHEGLLLPLSAQELRSATQASLVKHRLAPKRAGALAGAARRLDLDHLRDEPIATAIARLRREPMIGPWTSALVALNGLGSYAYGIAGDLNLIRLCSNLLDRAATVADTTALLARYGEWAGLASLHLARHPLAGRRTGHPTGTTTFGR